jgi:tetratricopeptide (TPR) repeat protein
MAGCGGGKLDSNEEQAALPEGHPSVDGSGQVQGSALGSSAPTDDDPMPLKLEGLSSVKELEKAMFGTKNDEARNAFAEGFRKTFTADAKKRDYPGAVKDLERAVELDPEFAEAYRALGYARFNMGFNIEAALEGYLKAIELKPDYGEAHYALAFMYAMSDLEKGGGHFKKAMGLGIPDERDLGTKFYSGN